MPCILLAPRNLHRHCLHPMLPFSRSDSLRSPTFSFFPCDLGLNPARRGCDMTGISHTSPCPPHLSLAFSRVGWGGAAVSEARLHPHCGGATAASEEIENQAPQCQD